MRHGILLLWSQLAWLFFCGGAAAASLFDDDTALEIELRGPIRETVRDEEKREEHPFVLSVDGIELDTMVRLRGKSRVVHCSFPPLRLRFEDAAATVFAGQGKLKLVTHCNKGSSYEINVLEEYAAYRILELVTPSALRARLLRIRYVDTDRPNAEPLERFGFLLESEEQLAERIGGTLVELAGVPPSRLEREQIASVFVAQYLIGNADYSLVAEEGSDACCHNGILVQVDDKLHYVPYDLDLTTLVNARYAQMKRRSGRRARRYLGYCFNDLDLEAAILRVRAARDRIFGEIHAIEATSGQGLEEATRFLKTFFDDAEDPERMIAYFEKNCLG